MVKCLPGMPQTLGSLLSSPKTITKQCLASGAVHWEGGCGLLEKVLAGNPGPWTLL